MKKLKRPLEGKKIAILLTDGFEEIEMTNPREQLKKAGAKTFLITPKHAKVKSWQHDKWGKYFAADTNLTITQAKTYDAILLPGGVMNPDKLRIDKKAVKFVTHFLQHKKPIAAICHGPWTLIETQKIKGLKVTSYHSIKSDLINAGAKWSNKKVVVDKQVLTSRTPKDLPAFNKAMIKLFAK